MERYANLAATTNTVNDYWCALATRPELFCLDIAGPSTLSNSLNTTAFDLTSDTVFSNGEFILDIYQTADNTSLNLFGQYDQCDGKVVGDGLINVFDIATMIAYIFKDYKYAELDPNPEQVVTVEGRDRLQLQCDDLVTRVEYLSSYATDTCVYFDNGCHGNLRWTTGCGNPTASGMNRQIHLYDQTLSSQTKREICAFECERRNCVNFEIQDAQCLTYMAECTDAGSTSGVLEEVYEATYSCNHDYLPTPPPPSPLPPAFPPSPASPPFAPPSTPPPPPSPPTDCVVTQTSQPYTFASNYYTVPSICQHLTDGSTQNVDVVRGGVVVYSGALTSTLLSTNPFLFGSGRACQVTGYPTTNAGCFSPPTSTACKEDLYDCGFPFSSSVFYGSEDPVQTKTCSLFQANACCQVGSVAMDQVLVQTSGTISDCSTICNQYEFCRGFEINSNGRCWLKVDDGRAGDVTEGQSTAEGGTYSGEIDSYDASTPGCSSYSCYACTSSAFLFQYGDEIVAYGTGRRRLSSYDSETSASRRLQQPLTPVTAQTLWSRWQSMPLLTPQDSPMTTRSWLPAVGARHDVTSVPARQLAVAQHTIYPDYDHPNGRWYTLRTASVSLRLHAVLTGLPGGQKNTKLSYRRYDGSPPDDPTQQEVRYTRFCEFGQCDSTCASIETAHPSRVAMQYNTLELVQRPIVDACPFETHIWVPYRSSTDDRCVGLEYLMIGDGVRGQFARDTACTRNLLSPPPPTPVYVGLPRPPPPPRPPPAPVVSYVPPPPPNASLTFSPPPSAAPPSADKSWVWIVSVTVLVLGCGCCCVALAVTRRRRDSDDNKEVYEDVVKLGGGLAPVITRAQGLGSANPNPVKARSNGHMTERRDVEEQTILSPPIQQNNYNVTRSARGVSDDTGLTPRRIPKLSDTRVPRDDAVVATARIEPNRYPRATTSTVQVNRYNTFSSTKDGTGLGGRRPSLPPIGEARIARTTVKTSADEEDENALRI